MGCRWAWPTDTGRKWSTGSGDELQVTVAGETFEHLLCNVILPYSNWQCVTVCRSESLLSLRRGLQTALARGWRRLFGS